MIASLCCCLVRYYEKRRAWRPPLRRASPAAPTLLFSHMWASHLPVRGVAASTTPSLAMRTRAAILRNANIAAGYAVGSLMLARGAQVAGDVGKVGSTRAALRGGRALPFASNHVFKMNRDPGRFWLPTPRRINFHGLQRRSVLRGCRVQPQVLGTGPAWLGQGTQTRITRTLAPSSAPSCLLYSI